MSVKNVFISHIHEEEPLAQVLKEIIETPFKGEVAAFISEDLPSGAKWLEEITKQLKIADVMIIACSPKSIERSWINFEAGAAWHADIPIIPFCHSGMTFGDLTDRLSTFNGILADNNDCVNQLIESLTNHFGFRYPPSFDAQNERTKILKSISDISDSVKSHTIKSTPKPKLS